MLSTRFTELVGCEVPIQQAGMGAASPPELTAAVSNAGALGMVGTARPGGRAVAGLQLLLDGTRALTSKPFGVNFLIPPGTLEATDPACFEMAARAARLVEFFYGWPRRDLVDLVHANDALVSWQVGSLAEARAAVEVGADIIIAQGISAGGHVRGTIAVFTLLEDVVQAQLGVPILAAGGIGNGRTMAAALAAGADGVRVGTRFVAAAEADAHPIYIQKLIEARAEDTVYTEAFSVGWPDAPHRCLRSCVEAASALNEDLVGERPSLDGTRIPVRRFSTGVATRDTTGNIEAMSLWAGESVSSVTRVQPAAEIISEFMRDCETSLALRERVGVRATA